MDSSDPQPTYRESGSRHSGPRPSSSPTHGSSGSWVSDSITDRPDRAKHGELDGRNTEDRTLALSGPRQRNAFSIHAPAVRIHRLVAELNPTGVSPGQTSRAHSLCRDQYQTRLSCAPGAHRSRRAACNRALLDPFSRSRCPKPACRAAVQLVQVPPRTHKGFLSLTERRSVPPRRSRLLAPADSRSICLSARVSGCRHQPGF